MSSSSNLYFEQLGPEHQSPILQSIVTSINDSISLLVHIQSSVLIFLNEKNEKRRLLQYESISYFFQQKMTVFLHIIVRKFNVSLTNDAISFEQLGPEVT